MVLTNQKFSYRSSSAQGIIRANINHTIRSSDKIDKFLQLSFTTSCFYDFVTKSVENIKNLKVLVNPPHKMWHF